MNPFPSLVLPGPGHGPVSSRAMREHFEPISYGVSGAVRGVMLILMLSILAWVWVCRGHQLYIPLGLFLLISSALTVFVWRRPSGLPLAYPGRVALRVCLPVALLSALQLTSLGFRISQKTLFGLVYLWTMFHGLVWIGACGSWLERPDRILRVIFAILVYWNVVFVGAQVRSAHATYVLLFLVGVPIACFVAAVAVWGVSVTIDLVMGRVRWWRASLRHAGLALFWALLGPLACIYSGLHVMMALLALCTILGIPLPEPQGVDH